MQHLISRICNSAIASNTITVSAALPKSTATAMKWRGYSTPTTTKESSSLGFNSTPTEVSAWLKSEGFPTPDVETLSGFNGRSILALSKNDAKELLGTVRGIRLFYAKSEQYKKLLEKEENDRAATHFGTNLDVDDPLNAEKVRKKEGFIIDMDGVIYHRGFVLPGVDRFLRWLKSTGKNYLFLTNSSDKSPVQLSQRLAKMGIEAPPSNFYTSALSTAHFLHTQKPKGSAYVIGEGGLLEALADVGYRITDINPDYVIVGETRDYDVARIEKAIQLVQNGAKLIGTNVDIYDRVGKNNVPACGSLISPIQICTGSRAYFCGKPNPLIMRSALKKLQVASSHAAIIGDRMDTDIVAGLESGIDTVLLLSGVTSPADLAKFSYSPSYIFNGIGSIVDHVSIE
eukprot:TRINITY_DN13267_c0_g1_i1.p1 TRINITY_DN13267_c0_g1~~TRINITY_DN13267_c0_g1_i1.p1  ORF type:complete len:401 (+),score=83.72 TRINITY_DN13267_c0_g1_i1:68-1270(+)